MTRNFTVGEWCGGRVAAMRSTPESLLEGGRWRPNPAYGQAAHEAAKALRTLAGHLGVRIDQIGPCATCPAYHQRYGDGGNPLCPECLAKVRADRGEL